MSIHNPFQGYDEKGLPLRNEDAFDFENYWRRATC